MKGTIFMRKLNSYTPTILTCIGAVGVVATSVLSVKATPKAMQLLEEAAENKGDNLTTIEIIRTAAPVYIPAVATGLGTIACLFGANVLNKRNQASLISAYALLDNSYKEYRKTVNELYGEDADHLVKEEIAKNIYEDEDVIENVEGNRLFFDFATMRYFEAPMEEVIQKTVLPDGLECYIINTDFE